MNARLGRGINLGNSWESDGLDDAGWANPIRDTDFATIKDAGFNSVRIPVRWQNNSNYTTHTVDPNRLQGVMEDIRLAIEQRLAVVINFHHYTELNCAGGGGTDGSGKKCEYNEATFANEKAHFLGLWTQVATALNTFPDDMVVLEILNEPIIPNEKLVDELMNDAYTVIRKAAPGKTIMFESYHAAKFAELSILHLPVNEGNVIYSGHYYEPYAYTHQGHGYECIGDKAKANTAAKDMKYYANLAKMLYPDVNGKDHIPLNMGEFGVAGGELSMACINSSPSNEGKAEWAQKTAQAAIDNGMSFHYWGFGRTGGFDAYNYDSESWYPGFPQALIPNKE
ncbi:MAG: cellulase family glycosylhydrolase [Fibrobacter sp.]|nr:cellulase family glycosylhydrolase [Fibrobacter sp.]